MTQKVRFNQGDRVRVISGINNNGELMNGMIGTIVGKHEKCDLYLVNLGPDFIGHSGGGYDNDSIKQSNSNNWWLDNLEKISYTKVESFLATVNIRTLILEGLLQEEVRQINTIKHLEEKGYTTDEERKKLKNLNEYIDYYLWSDFSHDIENTEIIVRHKGVDVLSIIDKK